MANLRSGMKSFVGTTPKKGKESTFSRLLTVALVIALLAMIYYKFLR